MEYTRRARNRRKKVEAAEAGVTHRSVDSVHVWGAGAAAEAAAGAGAAGAVVALRHEFE